MRGPLPVGDRRPGRAPARSSPRRWTTLKASKQPLGAEAIWGLNDWFRDFAPPLLLGADRGDQLLDPALQPAGHQLPRAAGPASTCCGRELTEVYPVGFLAQPPRAGDRDPQLQRRRSASACSPTATRSPTLDRHRPSYLDEAVEELRAAAGIASPGSMATSWQEILDLGSRASANASAAPEDAEERAPRRLPPPAREPLEEPPGADRGDLGQPLRPHRRGDLGAAGGGADPRRRRRADHGRGGRAARARGRGRRRRRRRRGRPRPPDRDPRRGRRDRPGADRPQRRAGGAADGRRQRHRQDDDDRQDRLAPLARSSASRSSSPPADTYRAAAAEQLAEWARARRRRAGPRARRAPTPARSPSTRSPPPAPAAPTSSSSTPPAASTPRAT